MSPTLDRGGLAYVNNVNDGGNPCQCHHRICWNRGPRYLPQQSPAMVPWTDPSRRTLCESDYGHVHSSSGWSMGCIALEWYWSCWYLKRSPCPSLERLFGSGITGQYVCQWLFFTNTPCHQMNTLLSLLSSNLHAYIIEHIVTQKNSLTDQAFTHIRKTTHYLILLNFTIFSWFVVFHLTNLYLLKTMVQSVIKCISKFVFHFLFLLSM